MNYGNILTTTWKTIWKEKVIIWFGMLMMIAPALMGILIGGTIAFSSLQKIERFFASDFSTIATLVFFFVYFFFIAFTIISTAFSFIGTLKGTLLAQTNRETLTFSTLWEASLPYLWRMLGVIFSIGLVLALIYLVPMLFFVLVGALTAGIGFLCAVPLFLLFIPVGLVGYLLFSLSMTALIAEDGSVIEAIQSAWNTLKEKFWPLVLMTIILYMLQFGIGILIAIPMNIIQFALVIPISMNNTNPDLMLRYFGIFMAIFLPLSSILQGFGLTYVNSAWMLSWLEASAPSAAPTETENEIIQYDA